MKDIRRIVHKDFLIIFVSEPEVYYVLDAGGGIIYYCINHLPFRLITWGKTNHRYMANVILEIISSHHIHVRERTGSLISNILGDLSGHISSFLEIDDIAIQSLKVMNGRSFHSVNRMIYDRVNSPIDYNSNNQVEYQVKNNGCFHGYLKSKTGKLDYIAVLFEGRILGDTWFYNDYLVSARVFDKDSGCSIPISQSGRNWFNIYYERDILSIGLLNCQINPWNDPGKIIRCGPFLIKYVAKNSLLRNQYPRYVPLSRFDLVIQAYDINQAWKYTNNLPSHYQDDDLERQILLTGRTESTLPISQF